jgi:hypothetical protein
MALFFIFLIIILSLYIVLCGVVFIYNKLTRPSSPTSKSALDLLIESCLCERNNFSVTPKKQFSCLDLFCRSVSRESEQATRYTKLSKLFLCAFVPAFTPVKSEWLSGFLGAEIFNKSFGIGKSFYCTAFTMNYKIMTFKKSIKALK